MTSDGCSTDDMSRVKFSKFHAYPSCMKLLEDISRTPIKFRRLRGGQSEGRSKILFIRTSTSRTL